MLVDGVDQTDGTLLDRISAHPHLRRLIIQPLDFDTAVSARIGTVPRAVAGRLLAGQHLSGQAVYLDDDTLVFGDISKLARSDLGGQPVGAVQDTMMLSWFAKSAKGRLHRGDRYRQILAARRETMTGFRADRYFNSGVMVFDFPRISELGLREAMEDVEAATTFRLPDQDHLNVVFSDRVAWLDPTWNGQWSNIETRRRYFDRQTRQHFAASRAAPKVLHYVGSRKPWEDMTRARFSRMLGIQQLPELPAMLAMRRTYAQWRDRAARYFGRDLFKT